VDKGAAGSYLEQHKGVSTMTSGKTDENTNMVPAATMV